MPELVALPRVPFVFKFPGGPGSRTDLPVLFSAVPVTQMAATCWLDVCQERDPIADENVSNCCITHTACMQRVEWEVRRIPQKKGVCGCFVLFLQFPREQWSNWPSKRDVCICDCMRETGTR